MKAERVLVDTSAWIASFKKTVDSDLKEFLKNSITAGMAATTSIIILELLQGCRTEEERDTLRTRLESLEVLSITQGVWERSYEMGFSLRRKGLTIPTVDLIIAALAVENSFLVLHKDKHFELIAQNHPDFKTKHFGLPSLK